MRRCYASRKRLSWAAAVTTPIFIPAFLLFCSVNLPLLSIFWLLGSTKPHKKTSQCFFLMPLALLLMMMLSASAQLYLHTWTMFTISSTTCKWQIREKTFDLKKEADACIFSRCTCRNHSSWYSPLCLEWFKHKYKLTKNMAQEFTISRWKQSSYDYAFGGVLDNGKGWGSDHR